MILASNPVNMAMRENRSGMGMGASPILPPGLGNPTTGAPAPTGNPVAAIAAMMGSAGNSGGGKPKGRGSRGPEKPSLARSSAISRRLNGAPSKGTELKGL